MIRKCAVSCCLLINLFGVTYSQSSRFADSLRLDSLTNLMLEQNAHQKFDSAIIYAKEVVSLTYSLYGSSREYAVSLNNLGYLYGQNFDYVYEEQFLKKALVALEKYAGKNDSDYAAFTNNLASLYNDLGNYSEAEPLYKESASIRKTIYGVESKPYAQSLNNLGNFYRQRENYELARTYLEQALSIRKKVDDSLYTQTLNTLALVIQKTGNYALAETKYKEALAVVGSSSEGKGTIEYRNILNNLASLYYD